MVFPEIFSVITRKRLTKHFANAFFPVASGVLLVFCANCSEQEGFNNFNCTDLKPVPSSLLNGPLPGSLENNFSSIFQ